MKKLLQLGLILTLCSTFGLAQVVISGSASLGGTLTCGSVPSGGGSTTLSVTPTSVSEGSIPTNTTAYFQPVTVTNTGSANLTFSSIGFTGTNSGDFSITPGFTPYGNAVLSTVSGYTSLFPSCTSTTPAGCPVTCSTSVPVAPGASCVVPIDFVPGANGSRNGTLQFADNAAGSPHTVALTGTGTAASGTLLTSSNCNTLLSAGTSYYFGGNISCNGSGFGLNGPNITVNQNGYTLTVGASPAYVGISSYGYYAAGSGDPAYTSPCVTSGVAHGCAVGTTPTTQDTYNDVIENGTIVLAGGATSAGTEQAGDEAIYPSYIPAENSDIYLHDMTVSIPVWCISCNVEGGLYGTTNTYNGVGDRVWKVTANNNSGQVQTRCEYEGASFLFANSSGTNDPGPIAYENTLTGSPQDGFAITTPHAYISGNNIAIGNALGTDAGTPSTCSGIGTGTNGTQSANDFAIGAYGNYGSIVNNTINTQSRGIDITAGASPGYTYSAGNTIASTVINNYVEYQGNGGNELGGALGARFNNFGVSSPGTYSSRDSITVTCGTSEGSAYSISNNATAGSHADNMTLVAKYGSGSAKDYNCNGVQDVSQAYSGSLLFTFNGGTVTSDTSDINIGNEEDASSGPLVFIGTTFVKPATAVAGWCGNSSFSVPEAGWVLVMSCYPGYYMGSTIGPLYLVNPTFTGGASYPSDDFALASTYIGSGVTISSFLQYTYQVTVTGASSGSPIVGATVTATDTASGLECTATTNSSGVANCNGVEGTSNPPLNNTERYVLTPGTPTTTTFNPFAFSISKSGCTTNTYSESITGPTVETKTLGAC